MKSDVLSLAAKRNMFLSPDALEYILSNSDPIDFTQTVLSSLSKNAVFVTKEDVIGCLNGESKIFESPKPITPRNKRQYDISIIPGTDVTGNSTCEGNIENFARYFQNRYAILKKIIEHRMDFGSAMSIDRAMTMDRDVKIIGIINDVKKTPNNHIILALEDDQGGTCKVLILNSSPYVKNIFVDDQVIGVIGRSGSKKNLLVADKIVYPDVPLTNEWIPSDSTSSVAFLSDVHVGSYTFLEKNWKKMIDWLKINAEKMEINYLILPGDVVDGIGIFPGQEEELSILDIYEQYETLGEYLKEIPDNIKMVIHPGNHDACRPAEPQPALNSVFTKTFDSNVMSVSNPVYINIEGRKILTYHGKSIDDWIANVQKLTYDNPIEVMKEMVTCRHLAPIYGQKTALAPEKKDYLAMETIPDIFVSGHIHGAGCTEYRGIKLINASTWQDQTEYQKMHNFNPNPGIMPIVQLGNGKITMKSFM